MARRLHTLLTASLACLLLSLVAGILKRLDEGSYPDAILFGGGAFVITMTLAIAILSAAGALKGDDVNHR